MGFDKEVDNSDICTCARVLENLMDLQCAAGACMHGLCMFVCVAKQERKFEVWMEHEHKSKNVVCFQRDILEGGRNPISSGGGTCAMLEVVKP